MKLKAYRESIGKTQKTCAEELEITVVYYSDLERGVFEPGRKLVAKISKWSKGKVEQKDLWK